MLWLKKMFWLHHVQYEGPISAISGFEVIVFRNIYFAVDYINTKLTVTKYNLKQSHQAPECEVNARYLSCLKCHTAMKLLNRD